VLKYEFGENLMKSKIIISVDNVTDTGESDSKKISTEICMAWIDHETQ